ncbi:MAG: hypothetical protein WC378_03160 [Opitutaceae bacterium]
MTNISFEILIGAKREVSSLIKQGKLISPQDAWMISGHSFGYQTLWSVSRRFAESADVSAEDLCAYLEKQYPQHAGLDGQKIDWHDIIHKANYYEGLTDADLW